MRVWSRQLLPLLACMVCLACGSTPTPAPEAEVAAPSTPAKETAKARPEGRPYAHLVTSRGEMVIKLLPELAPKTVQNFVDLARMGLYTRTTFHRVMPGKMIQGGDPNTRDRNPYNDGQGNSGRFIPAEFSKRPMTRGAVAMARSPGDPDSASSQFFVVLRRTPQWDGQYTIFGEVVEGIEVADRISRAPLSRDPRLENHPTANIRIRRVEIEYRKE